MPLLANTCVSHRAALPPARAGHCRRRCSRNILGFSLPELLVATGVISIVLLATSLMLTTEQYCYSSTGAAITAQNEASRAFDTMYREVSAAHNLSLKDVVCTGCALDFQLPLGIQTGNTLWGAVDKNGQNQTGWNVEYRLNIPPNGRRQLIRVLQSGGADVPGETALVIANDVDPAASNLFELLTGVVKIHLKITSPMDGFLTTYTRTSGSLSTEIQLRGP